MRKHPALNLCKYWKVLIDNHPTLQTWGNYWALLYDFIQATKSSLLVVSHDRKLLHLLGTVFELSQQGIKVYGGNYNFYKEQKEIENNALNQHIEGKEKALRKAKEKEREAI